MKSSIGGADGQARQDGMMGGGTRPGWDDQLMPGSRTGFVVREIKSTANKLKLRGRVGGKLRDETNTVLRVPV